MAQPISKTQNAQFWNAVNRQVLSFFRNRNRPLLIGEVALWIGMNLKQTKAILDDLAERNLLRELNDEELRELRYHKGYAFILTDPKRIPMGDPDSIPADVI